MGSSLPFPVHSSRQQHAHARGLCSLPVVRHPQAATLKRSCCTHALLLQCSALQQSRPQGFTSSSLQAVAPSCCATCLNRVRLFSNRLTRSTCTGAAGAATGQWKMLTVTRPASCTAMWRAACLGASLGMIVHSQSLLLARLI